MYPDYEPNLEQSTLPFNSSDTSTSEAWTLSTSQTDTIALDETTFEPDSTTEIQLSTGDEGLTITLAETSEATMLVTNAGKSKQDLLKAIDVAVQRLLTLVCLA